MGWETRLTLDNIVQEQALSESIQLWKFPLGKETDNNKPIGLKITCFLSLSTVLFIKDIWDSAWHLATRGRFGTLGLRAELGLIWVVITSTENGLLLGEPDLEKT